MQCRSVLPEEKNAQSGMARKPKVFGIKRREYAFSGKVLPKKKKKKQQAEGSSDVLGIISPWS
jgi:hypothetical protein